MERRRTRAPSRNIRSHTCARGEGRGVKGLLPHRHGRSSQAGPHRTRPTAPGGITSTSAHSSHWVDASRVEGGEGVRGEGARGEGRGVRGQGRGVRGEGWSQGAGVQGGDGVRVQGAGRRVWGAGCAVTDLLQRRRVVVGRLRQRLHALEP